jgi:flagellar biosynthesis anti-sigma factor FlgM
MKIPENNSLKRLYGVDTEPARQVDRTGSRDNSSKAVSASLSKDQASVSESAKLLAKASAVLGDSPQVRADIVDKFRQEIESGNYEIPYADLANRLATLLKPAE